MNKKIKLVFLRGVRNVQYRGLKSVINSLVYYFNIIDLKHDLKHFPILNLSLVNIHICDFYSFCSRFAPELSYILSFVDKFHCSSAKDSSVTTAFQLPLNPINYLLFPDRCGTEKAI